MYLKFIPILGCQIHVVFSLRIVLIPAIPPFVGAVVVAVVVVRIWLPLFCVFLVYVLKAFIWLFLCTAAVYPVRIGLEEYDDVIDAAHVNISRGVRCPAYLDGYRNGRVGVQVVWLLAWFSSKDLLIAFMLSS